MKKSRQKKKSLKTAKKTDEVQPDLNILLEVIKDKNSTTSEIKEAVDLLLKYYGKIPKKLGMRAHPKFEIYSELLIRICHHPHVNKEIIVRLDKELQRLNPEYKLEIEDSLTKGLNTRGI